MPADFGVVFYSRLSPPTQAELEFIQESVNEMPVVSYDVTKIIRFKGKCPRRLLFSKEGICNLRDDQVSSMYSYGEVSRISIKNYDHIMIEYFPGSHVYHYVSEVSMQIVQELTKRVSSVSSNTSAKRRSVLFRDEKKVNDLLQQLLTEAPTSASYETDEAKVEDEDELFSMEDEMMEDNDGENRTNNAQRSANKLEQMTGVTELERLTLAINSIILSKDTPEGNTVAHFLSTFDASGNFTSAAGAVRQFLNGMKDYMLESRASELGNLSMVTKVSSVQLEDNSLSNLAETALQNAVVGPLMPQLLACWQRDREAVECEERTQKCVRKLQNLTQLEIGIPEQYQSLTNYSAAVKTLRKLDLCTLPSELISSLLASAKSLYRTVTLEQTRKLPPGHLFTDSAPVALSADDFLPIHIYVTLQAQLKSPEFHCQLMWELCDPSFVCGEAGYYLTVFNSALRWIESQEDMCSSEEKEKKNENENENETDGMAVDVLQVAEHVDPREDAVVLDLDPEPMDEMDSG